MVLAAGLLHLLMVTTPQSHHQLATLLCRLCSRDLGATLQEQQPVGSGGGLLSEWAYMTLGQGAPYILQLHSKPIASMATLTKILFAQFKYPEAMPASPSFDIHRGNLHTKWTMPNRMTAAAACQVSQWSVLLLAAPCHCKSACAAIMS